MIEQRNHDTRLLTLDKVADILPGFSTGASFQHQNDGTHQLVLSRHLQPGLPYSYRKEDEFRVHPASGRDSGDGRARDVSRYELKTGDVLFMSRGTRNVASRIADVPVGSIAPVSFFILRPRTGGTAGAPGLVLPEYLVWYLNTSIAQNDIANIRTGAGTPIVQRSAFRELRIPVPDANTQRRIGNLGETMMRERLLQEQLTHAVARGHDSINTSLARLLITEAGLRTGDSG